MVSLPFALLHVFIEKYEGNCAFLGMTSLISNVLLSYVNHSGGVGDIKHIVL